MLNLLKRNPLVSYFALAILFSWAIYIPLVFVRQGWTEAKIPYSIHYLASFGPALAALIMTALTSGKAGLQELWSRITRWRVDWRYAAFALLSPVVLFAIAAIGLRMVQGVWPDLRLLGQANYLPYLGWEVLPLWLVTFGFGEEIGWRGFALPRLQKTMSVSKATLILGLLWFLWHVPAFFYHETYVDMSWIVLLGFFFGVLCGAVLFTWLYNGTGGSILMVAVWQRPLRPADRLQGRAEHYPYPDKRWGDRLGVGRCQYQSFMGIPVSAETGCECGQRKMTIRICIL